MNYFITASMDFLQDMDKYNTPINIYIDLSKALTAMNYFITASMDFEKIIRQNLQLWK